jgi:hypothetical protein
LLVVKAIRIIVEHFYKTSNELLKDNMYLNQWIQCEETFNEVCSKLSPKVRSIDEYCKILQKVRHLVTCLATRKL